MTFLIAVPTGVKFFNWIGTMWGGSISFDTPMLWSVGFLTTFLFGGLTGVILASRRRSTSTSPTATSSWRTSTTSSSARWSSRCSRASTSGAQDERPDASEPLGKVHFWLLFVGFHTTFLVQHWVGVEGFPRRYADYGPNDGFTLLNQISTVGAFLLALSTLPFLWNVYVSARGPKVSVDDPWGWGRSLEWATSCPPPRHNFVTLPADPLGVARVRPAPPRGRGARVRRQRPRGRAVRRPDMEGRAEQLGAQAKRNEKGEQQ